MLIFTFFNLKYVQFLSYYWENNHNDDYIQFSVVDFDGILFSDCVQLKLFITSGTGRTKVSKYWTGMTELWCDIIKYQIKTLAY